MKTRVPPVMDSRVVRETTMYQGGKQDAKDEYQPDDIRRDNAEQDKPNVEEELQQVANELNEYTQSIKRELYFTVTPGSYKEGIQVIDAQTSQLIRFIPADEAIKNAHKISRAINKQGFIFKVKV